MLSRVIKSAALSNRALPLRRFATESTSAVEKKEDPNMSEKRQRKTLSSFAGQKQFFDALGKKLGISESNLEKWYDVSRDTLIKEKGGRTILKMYSGLLGKALPAVYPDHKWEPFQFHSKPPASYWRDPTNQRAYFEWLKDKLGVTKPEDWYTVNWEAAVKRKDIGHGLRHILLVIYGGSIGRAIPCIYPDQAWNRQKFPRLNSLQLVDLDTKLNMVEVKSYIDHLAQELKIKKPEDWYYVSMNQIKNVEGYKKVPKRLGGLPGLLIRAYPEYTFDAKKFPYGAVTQRGYAGSTRRVPTRPARRSKKAELSEALTENAYSPGA